MALEIILTAIAGILVSPVLWKGITSLYNVITKNKRLTNNEFKDYLFKKVEEQSIHIDNLNIIIVELKVEIAQLRSEIKSLRKLETENHDIIVTHSHKNQ